MPAGWTLMNPRSTWFRPHEVAVHIIEHLIGIDVAVIVRRRNGLWVVIVHPRRKSADHKVVCLKSLMDGRRHVYAAGDGLKIFCIECIGIIVTVPTHHIEGVRIVDQAVQMILFPDDNGESPFFVPRVQPLWLANVAFTVWAVLQ